MPLMQNTFTIVPNAINFSSQARRANSDNPSDAPQARPAMTSKQAQKLYKAEQAKKYPKVSKAEQRRLDKEEQGRIRKEFEKDKQATKARAAREKKKQKEDLIREDKRRKGQPLVDVRPSQDTIARFVRAPAAMPKKRDAAAAGLAHACPVIEEEDEAQDKENDPLKETRAAPPEVDTPAAKRPRLSSPRPLPPAIPAAVPSPDLSVAAKKPTSAPEAPGNVPNGPLRLSVPPALHVPAAKGPIDQVPAGAGVAKLSFPRTSESPKAPAAAPPVRRSNRPKPRTSMLPPRAVDARKPPQAKEASPARFAHPGLQLSEKTHKSPAVPPRKPLQETPGNASRISHAGLQLAEKKSYSPSVASVASAPSPRTGTMAAPPRPPQFKPPQTGGKNSPLPKFLPGHLNASRSRAPVQAPRTQAKGREPGVESLPPTSTQLFLMNNLDDFLPSPSQQARELLEDMSPTAKLAGSRGTLQRTTAFKTAPGMASAPTLKKFASATLKTRPNVLRSAAHVKAAQINSSKPIHGANAPNTRQAPNMRELQQITKKPTPPKPRLDPFPFFSTQDLFMSSQDMREVAEPGSSGLSSSACGREDCPDAVSQRSFEGLPPSKKPSPKLSKERTLITGSRAQGREPTPVGANARSCVPERTSQNAPSDAQSSSNSAESSAPPQRPFFTSSGIGADMLLAMGRSKRDEELRLARIAREERDARREETRRAAEKEKFEKEKAAREMTKAQMDTGEADSQETDYGDIDMGVIAGLDLDGLPGSKEDSVSDYGDLDDDLDLLAAIKY